MFNNINSQLNGKMIMKNKVPKAIDKVSVVLSVVF